MSEDPLQTEFSFTLPRGYVDDAGTRHTEGRMRLATAGDEISPLGDPRVQSNESYLTVLMLSRVVTQLGSVETVDPDVIESLFVEDMEHLQAMYERINGRGADAVETVCPDCGTDFDVAVEDGAHVDTDAPRTRADGTDGVPNVSDNPTALGGDPSGNRIE